MSLSCSTEMLTLGFRRFFEKKYEYMQYRSKSPTGVTVANLKPKLQAAKGQLDLRSELLCIATY